MNAVTLSTVIIVQVQLMVTPKVEGILNIVGIRWKLSGSVVGLYKFESNLVKKKIARGRRKANYSPGNDLKFIVIKVHSSCAPSPPLIFSDICNVD